MTDHDKSIGYGHMSQKKYCILFFFVVTHHAEIVSYDEYKQLKRTN